MKRLPNINLKFRSACGAVASNARVWQFESQYLHFLDEYLLTEKFKAGDKVNEAKMPHLNTNCRVIFNIIIYFVQLSVHRHWQPGNGHCHSSLHLLDLNKYNKELGNQGHPNHLQQSKPVCRVHNHFESFNFCFN